MSESVLMRRAKARSLKATSIWTFCCLAICGSTVSASSAPESVEILGRMIDAHGGMTTWQAPTPPRFLALLNYYFLNLLWLTQDPGVIFASPQTARLWDDPQLVFHSALRPGPHDDACQRDLG